MICFGSCSFLRGLWIEISGEIADIHMRSDAKNLVTTARTIHLPEQKGDNPNDFCCERSSSLSNSELFGRLFDEGISQGRQLDHGGENKEIIRC